MRRWRLEDAPELRSTRSQPHERRTCPLQPQVRQDDERARGTQKKRKREKFKNQKNYENLGSVSYKSHTRPLQTLDARGKKALLECQMPVFLVVILCMYVCVCEKEIMIQH